ncbi:MAG TPA: T9SS type A sorting domain-containing protein [Flavobacteriaceae bacterium]|nr:T9SS type A sorting domain-containing protein [Flavobacteriaceae bacterium]MCB9213755.1 T9SS type A sorting domain-containing protein [Alteromonas sp.]HPF11328.1 T9SS type A sorting domain-containing protein [Flavobacteriaceae bacterium]HQU22157.1 T9SS type A sorting domain-containing protein [Flavobacteriaceae bacterium]HQU64453.1 T9SS type A sorting domain-containing protein [Flavobacteriaceae bacterium]
MKKVISSLLVAFAVFNLSGQSRTLEQLVQSIENAAPSLLPFQFYLDSNFSYDEQQLLKSYYAEIKNEKSTIGFQRGITEITHFITQEIYSFHTQFGAVPVTPPFTFYEISAPTDEILFADDFDGSGVLYGLDYFDSQLVIIEPNTATITPVGPLTNLVSNHLPSGLSWNPVTETMYALSGGWDINVFTGAQLYSVNLENGELTPIGGITTEPIGFWLEIDNNGIAYVASNEKLYTIDLETGIPTEVGPFGAVTLNYTQEASIDPETNKLYAATYRSPVNAFICEIDKATGNATILGSTNGDEYGAFSFSEIELLGRDEFLKNEIIIHPNPSNAIVNIDIPGGNTIKDIQLFNSLGMSQKVVLTHNTIDISNLPSGVYFLRLIIGETRIQKKLIKL